MKKGNDMMNKTIRRIAAVAAAVICLGLVSCGNSGNTDNDLGSSKAGTAAPAVTLPDDGSDSSEDIADDSADNDSSLADGEESDEYTPAMWLVTSPEGETMYMMGSMHALRDECYPLPDYVQQAYEQADVLAVECDISDTTASFSAALKQMEKMYYDDGTTLKDHLSEEQYNEIDSYMKAHGDKLELYDGFQLWYLSQFLSTMALEDAKLDSTKGLDMNLLTMAHEDGKEVYEVESIDFQMDLLVGFSEDIYKVQLSGYSEDNIELLTEQYEQLYTAWRTGDLESLMELNEGGEVEEEYTEEETALIEEYNKQLVTDRNIGMAEKAEQLMADGKNTLYVVGAAHFVGDGGIIDLLTKDGYTCELVK